MLRICRCLCRPPRYKWHKFSLWSVVSIRQTRSLIDPINGANDQRSTKTHNTVVLCLYAVVPQFYLCLLYRLQILLFYQSHVTALRSTTLVNVQTVSTRCTAANLNVVHKFTVTCPLTAVDGRFVPYQTCSVVYYLAGVKRHPSKTVAVSVL